MGDAGRRRRSQLELVDEDKSPLLGKKGSPDLGSFIGHESSSFFPRSSVAGTAREFMAWRAFALSLSLSPPPNNHHLLLLPFLFRCPYKRHQSARNQPSLSLFPEKNFSFLSICVFGTGEGRQQKKKKRSVDTVASSGTVVLCLCLLTYSGLFFFLLFLCVRLDSV